MCRRIMSVKEIKRLADEIVSPGAEEYAYDISLSRIEELQRSYDVGTIFKVKEYILDKLCHYFCHSSCFEESFKFQENNCNRCLKMLFYVKDAIYLDTIYIYSKDVMEDVFEQLNNNEIFPNISWELLNILSFYEKKYDLPLDPNNGKYKYQSNYLSD